MNSFLKSFLLIFTTFTLIVFLGCEKKTDTPDMQEVEEETEEPAMVIPDLMGTWTGKFDNRATTLRITEQTDSSFTGKITISYREVINQDVTGTLSPSTNRINMKDMLHSRYRGTYSGSLSEDGTTYAGTFTMDLDKTKFQFSLKKQQ
jgi:hypothetical protein